MLLKGDLAHIVFMFYPTKSETSNKVLEQYKAAAEAFKDKVLIFYSVTIQLQNDDYDFSIKPQNCRFNAKIYMKQLMQIISVVL